MTKRLSLVGAGLLALVLVLVVAAQFLRARPPAEQSARAEPTTGSAAQLGASAVETEGGGVVAVPAAAPQVSAEAAPRKFQRRFMFDCNGDRIFVRIGEGEAALLPPGSLTGYWIPLEETGFVWRGRYANEDVVFRPDGGVATFVLGDDTLENCVRIPDVTAFAEAGGRVMVQAFGSDPPWTFEITLREFTLTTDRGARRVEVPFREPIDDGSRVTFRSVLGTQEMVATLDRIPCYDAASGETFAQTVAVVFDRAWYYGCGRVINYR